MSGKKLVILSGKSLLSKGEIKKLLHYCYFTLPDIWQQRVWLLPKKCRFSTIGGVTSHTPPNIYAPGSMTEQQIAKLIKFIKGFCESCRDTLNSVLMNY